MIFSTGVAAFLIALSCNLDNIGRVENPSKGSKTILEPGCS